MEINVENFRVSKYTTNDRFVLLVDLTGEVWGQFDSKEFTPEQIQKVYEEQIGIPAKIEEQIIGGKERIVLLEYE